MLIHQTFTSFDTNVLVHEEEDPQRSQPGHIANQNVRGPRLGEQERRLFHPHKHGGNCSQTWRVDLTADSHCVSDPYVSIGTTDVPGLSCAAKWQKIVCIFAQ